MFEIHLGIPEMEELWNRLANGKNDGAVIRKSQASRAPLA